MKQSSTWFNLYEAFKEISQTFTDEWSICRRQRAEKKLSTNKVSVIFNFGTVVLCAVRLSVRKCTTLNSRGHKMGNFKSSKFCQLNWPEYIDQTQKTRAALTDIDVNCSGTPSNGRLYVQSHTAELTDKPIASPIGITLYAYCLYADWWLIYWHIQVFCTHPPLLLKFVVPLDWRLYTVDTEMREYGSE